MLAHLEPAKRGDEVMERIYGEDGANFSMARTTIGVDRLLSGGQVLLCCEIPGDSELRTLQHRSVDRDGFSTATRYPGVKDESFDVLADDSKKRSPSRLDQSDSSLRIVASAWTAPPWMKDIEDWYVPMSPAERLPGDRWVVEARTYVKTYAELLGEATSTPMRQRAFRSGRLTPVNEPEGNNGQWESMHFTPEDSERVHSR